MRAGLGDVEEAREGDLVSLGAESESWFRDRRSSASAPVFMGFAGNEASSLGRLACACCPSPYPLGAAMVH